MFVDCHCHLSFPEYSADLKTVVSDLGDEFYALIENTISPANTHAALELLSKYTLVRFALGFHPYYAGECTDETIKEYARIIGENKNIVAIGEVGLDYKSKAPLDVQKSALVRFLDLAKQYDLPVIIHNRGFKEKLLAMIKEQGPAKVMFHCFSQDKEFLQDVLASGYFVSFATNLTFKNAHMLREAAKLVPDDRILAETDSPYLAPQIIRGRRNSPMYVKEVIKEIARLKEKEPKYIEDKVLENAKRIFNLKG